MDRILRADEGWQAAIAEALSTAPRPIRVDPRLQPRTLSTPAQRARWDRSNFPPARPASTLLLLYPGRHSDDAGDAGELVIPLTVRHAELRDHAGEISLPGGAVEADDATRSDAALRETEEEIGVPAASVRVVGTLDDVWIPVSNYELRPFVGCLASAPDFHLKADEVAAVVELPLRRLLAPDGITEETIEGPGWRLQAAVYRWQGHRVWGATARTLAMFAAVLASEGTSEGA